MTRTVPSAERFSFVRRPVPVPGDLRIVWRLSLLLMMLEHRGARRRRW